MEHLTTMDELFTKMGEYTKMEDELAFSEFVAFYNDLIAFLQKDYQDLTNDDLLKAKGITAIVAANARMRALRKDNNRKKFVKMGEKSAFWEDAITRRLTKEGLSDNEMQDKLDQLWQ